MNIIICSVYSRAVFISLDVALWGSVYSRAVFISLDVALWGGVYSRAVLNRVNTVYIFICRICKISTLIIICIC